MNAKMAGRDIPLLETAVVTLFPGAPCQLLHVRLVDGIRRLINEGDLAPGSRIQEQALCKRFDGVSRTPLREALKVLAAEGLVVLLPRRGARVAALDEAQLRHLFEVVAMLEAEAGRLACQRIDAAAFAEIQALHYQMHAHHLRGDLPAYFACNQQIHAAIIAAAANPVLTATHASLAGRIVRARYLANRLDTARWRRAMAEHAQMLADLERRDGDALAATLAAHLINKRDSVLAQLADVLTT